MRMGGLQMDKNNSFQATRRFTDDEHFPYGFARSGDFTIWQANLLEAYGHAFRALESGERQPESQLEIDFVAFCRGEKPAESEHEKVWKRYRRSVSEDTHRYSLSGLGANNSSNAQPTADY
jgi:hypothetical protein